MRLIDADALLKDARRLIDTYAEDGHEHYTHINAIEVAAVNAAPTIEAEPVRHGRWEVVEPYGWTKHGYHSLAKIRCTLCGHIPLPHTSSDYTHGGIINTYRWDRSDYCPNCGAKMDAKEENT